MVDIFEFVVSGLQLLLFAGQRVRSFDLFQFLDLLWQLLLDQTFLFLDLRQSLLFKT